MGFHVITNHTVWYGFTMPSPLNQGKILSIFSIYSMAFMIWF